MAGRASQIVGEVEASGTPKGRASQIVGEVEASGSPSARASQIVGKVAASGSPNLRVSQFAIEILVGIFEVTQPPIYPDLPGLTYPVVWRPNFFVQGEKSGSGAEVDISLATSPIWEWELSYTILRNMYGPNSIELKTMLGFMLNMNGPAGRFLYLNPHDNAVTSEPLGTTDGTSTIYGPITRTYGVGPNIGVEPVGYLDLTRPIVVYLNGIPQTASTYSFLTTTPGNMQLKFNAAPSAGKVITLDFGFFYYCKFADPKNDFREFMSNLFELQKVVIRSCRAGT